MKRLSAIGLCALLLIGLHAGASTLTAAQGSSTQHGTGARVKILLFGDSVALTLGWPLNQKSLSRMYGYSFKDLGILGCGVVMSRVCHRRRSDGAIATTM